MRSPVSHQTITRTKYQREAVPVDREDALADLLAGHAHIIAGLTARVSALEARLDAREGRGGAVLVPPELEAERLPGESDADLRRRWREKRAALYSQMMGAKEGVGEFSERDRARLNWLQSLEWLGPE